MVCIHDSILGLPFTYNSWSRMVYYSVFILNLKKRYAYGIYCLNLFIIFLSPHIDPEEDDDAELPLGESQIDEKNPS